MDKNDVIMTKESNPEVLAICYAQGWCAHENYMTKREAQAVEVFPGNLFNGSNVVNFDEFRFFTGIKSIDKGSSGRIVYQATKLQTVAFPENLADYRGYVFRGAFRTNTYPFKRVILGSGCTRIGSDSFYQWQYLASVPQIVICKPTTPPTLSTTRNNSISYITLYVPDNSVTAYSEATQWSTAKEILPLSQCPAEYLEYHGLLKD